MNNPPSSIEAALAADAADLQRQQTATRRANTEPLPGPLDRAFAPEELAQFGFVLRPVVASDFILLKKLNSPLYRQTFVLAEHARQIKSGELPEDAPPPRTEYDEDECVEMIFQFTRPLPVVREIFRRGTNHNPDAVKARDLDKIKADQRAWFREQALAAVTDAIPINRFSDFPRLVATVIENFTAAFSTAVHYESPQPEGEETVFTTPAVAGATASAGGSTTSRGSPAAIPPAKTSSSTSSL